jgi:hypothetical protein
MASQVLIHQMHNRISPPFVHLQKDMDAHNLPITTLFDAGDDDDDGA